MDKYLVKFPVRYAETDQMGIVHHSVYPIWFEVGRTQGMKEIGISYEKIEEMGIMLPVLECTCRYLAPAHYGEEMLIQTCIQEISPTRLTFGYEVYKDGEDKVLCKGSTMHVWTNRNLRPINLKKIQPDLFDRFKASSGSK